MRFASWEAKEKQFARRRTLQGLALPVFRRRGTRDGPGGRRGQEQEAGAANPAGPEGVWLTQECELSHPKPR